MRAAVLRAGQMAVDEVPDPEPGPGQLLVRTLACGICGSDLHAVHHGDQLVAMQREAADAADGIPMAPPMDLACDVVMGHEFCGEVVGVGEGAGNHAEGDLVVSVPVTFDVQGVHPIGYSNLYPGGYGELLVVSDALALRVPDGLDPELAALTEPMAVGLHAVNRSRVAHGHGAVVIGAGPVGLAVVAALAAAGIEPIVAADFSPTRRDLAERLGAHQTVDPADEPVGDAWRRIGRTGQPVVLFEAVGVPGLIDESLAAAPRGAQVVVVGVCMVPDTIRPLRAIGKELNIQFVLGYDPLEFAETLRRIADGDIDVAPLVTGRVRVDEVPRAFEDLADPGRHAKILVAPG